MTRIDRSPVQDAPQPAAEHATEGALPSVQGVLLTQERLRHLLQANRAVVEQLELEEVLQRIVEAAVALVDARYGALGVIASDGSLEHFVQVGVSVPLAAKIGHAPAGHGLLGAVIQAAQPIRVNDLHADPRSSGFPAHHPEMEGFLGVPIRVRMKVYGNLYLTSRNDGPFTQEDEDLISALAATAGIAIDNARLYAEQAAVASELALAKVDSQQLELIEDRNRIARDLHDHVIQRLFATGLGLQSMVSQVPEALRAQLIEHVDATDAAIADIRTAVFTLSSREPMDQPAIRHRVLDVVNDLSVAFPIAPRLTFSGPVDLMIDGELALDVIAVVREGLTNVSRHAGATQTSVDVSVRAGEVRVTIDDDGRGMPESTARKSGTTNLASRAAAHGGEFALAAREPRGTSLRWSAPVTQPS